MAGPRSGVGSQGLTPKRRESDFHASSRLGFIRGIEPGIDLGNGQVIADIVAVIGTLDRQTRTDEKLGRELGDGAFSLAGMEAGNSMLHIEFLGVFASRKL